MQSMKLSLLYVNISDNSDCATWRLKLGRKEMANLAPIPKDKNTSINMKVRYRKRSIEPPSLISASPESKFEISPPPYLPPPT